MIEALTSNETVAAVTSILGALYALATAIAAVTPSDKDNTFLEKVGKWADRIGFKVKGK
mgnify:CR=1 FL=1|tara:strand:- start:793 stop:969 length:177 start_codon:yes stop_codon:yes gene_type:complete